MDDQERLARLARLSKYQAPIFRLWCDNYSYAEIARIIGKSKANVQYHLGHAFEILGLAGLSDEDFDRESAAYRALVKRVERRDPAEEIKQLPPESDPKPPTQRALVRVLAAEPPEPIRISVPAISTRPPQPRLEAPPATNPWPIVAGIAVVAAMLGGGVVALATSLLTPQVPPSPMTGVERVITATPPPPATISGETAPSLARPTATSEPVPTTTPSPVPPTPTRTAIVPTATPAPPASGTVLYSSNWSSGWPTEGAWQASGDALYSSGLRGTVAVPYLPAVSNYAVEVEAQILDDNGKFDIGIRGGSYYGGLYMFNSHIFGTSIRIHPAGDPNNHIGQSVAFSPGRGWHTYRFEAQGNIFRFLIDGNLFIEGKHNGNLTGRPISLSHESGQITVRALRIIAL